MGYTALKAEEYFLGLLNGGTNVYIFIKIIIVVFGKRRRDSLVNGVQEIEKKFKYGKNNINEKIIVQRIRYRFPQDKTRDQLDNVFVFDLETHKNQESAEAYAAGLYDATRLRDSWDREVTSDEKVIEKKLLLFSMDLIETLSRTTLNIFQKNTKVMKGRIVIKTETRELARRDVYWWHITPVVLIAGLY